jgi:hypothetical protein
MATLHACFVILPCARFFACVGFAYARFFVGCLCMRASLLLNSSFFFQFSHWSTRVTSSQHLPGAGVRALIFSFGAGILCMRTYLSTPTPTKKHSKQNNNDVI